jgi:hypothetical protein
MQRWWAPVMTARATRRRAAGRYDDVTLRLFWAAWQAQGDALSLCRLAAFRRDLGHPLPRRWVLALRVGLASLPPRWRRRALGMLAEVAPASLHGLPADWLADARRIPGVAALVAKPEGADPKRLALTPPVPPRQAFQQWLKQHKALGHTLVVGNAATLAGRGLGPVIDAAGVVFRFNQWHADDTSVADTGQRCDVWVVAPGHVGPLPPGVSWLVVSGADPWFQVEHWPLASDCDAAGVPVLTVPLQVWRSLVAELQAPPSAGLLVLAWLRAWGSDGSSCCSAGIATGPAAGGRHHLVAAAEARIGSRHDWAAEARLHTRWREQGLRCLPET